MATEIGQGIVPVGFDKAQIAKDAEEAITPALTSAAANAAKLFAGLAIGREIAQVGKAGLNELIQQQTVAAQTTVALRNETNITADAIDNLGQSMLDLAGFDDEAAKSAANILLRFGAIHDEGTLKRVEQDAADLARQMGVDLPQAAQTLGQILQDPENAARKLRPIIGSLTDAQKESIQTFIDQGDVASAQGVILQTLEERIGGAAKAFGETLEGSLDRFGEQSKNTKAAFLDDLAGPAQVAVDAGTNLLKVLEDLPPPLRDVIGLLAAGGTGLIGLAQPVGGLIQSFNDLRTARILNTTVTQASTVATTESTVAEGAQAVALSQAAAAAQRKEVELYQLLVANQQLVFSDAEVTAAQEAQQLAAVQALVSNDALIASEEQLAAAEAAQALAAAEAAAATSEAGLGTVALGEGAAASLGPIALVVAGLAAIPLALTAFSSQGSSKLDEIDQEIKKLSSDLQQMNADPLQVVTKNLNDLIKTDKPTRELFNSVGLTVSDFVAALKDGQPALDALIAHLDSLGPAGREAASRVAELSAEQQNASRDALEAGVAQGKFTQAQVDAEVATSRLANDGFPNYVAALDVLDGANLGATAGIQSMEGELRALEAAYNQVASAALQILPANQRLEAANRAVRRAQDRLANPGGSRGGSSESNEPDPDKIAAAQTRVAESALSIQDAQLKLAEATDKANEAQEKLAKNQDVAKADDFQKAVTKANLDLQKAQLGVEQATQRQTAAQKELDKAQNPDKAKAAASSTNDVADAQDQLNQALKDQADAQAAVNEANEELNGHHVTELEHLKNLQQEYRNLAAVATGPARQAMLDLADDLQPVIDKLDEANRKLFNIAIVANDPTKLAELGNNRDFIDYLAGGLNRATGGPVPAGVPFTGAENGYELALLAKNSTYQFSSDAFVLPHEQSRALLSGRRGGDTYNIQALDVDEALWKLDKHNRSRDLVLSEG